MSESELENTGEAGYFALKRTPVPCPAGCGREGALLEVGAVTVAVLCEPCQTLADEKQDEQDRRERIAGLLAHAGCDELMRDWTLESYPVDILARAAALEAARAWLWRYIDGERENVLVYGNVGAGKTGLAWGIVRQLCELEYEAMLVNFDDLLLELVESFDERGRPSDYIRARLVPVLVVDDIGTERPTDFARSELRRLVERRYKARKPTWFTSNYEPDQLAERLGHDDLVIGTRIVSRMVEGAVQIRLEGDDLRPG